MSTEYLSVDLILDSPKSLEDLLSHFGEEIIVHHFTQTQSVFHYEIGFSSDYDSPDSAISNLCGLINGLPTTLRTDWANCISRIFDIGFEADSGAPLFSTPIKSFTLSQLPSLGVDLAITIYTDKHDYPSAT